MTYASLLADYLTTHGQTKARFARTVGAAPSQISRLVAGLRGPSAALAYEIERATRGAVPIVACTDHWPSKRRRKASRRAS